MIAGTAALVVQYQQKSKSILKTNNKAMIVIKFGGAAITEKKARGVLNEAALRLCCDGIASAWSKAASVVVIHGAGSFGHSEAKENSVHLGRNKNEFGFSLTRQAVTRLNSIVVNQLIDRGVPAVAISPFAARQGLTEAVTNAIDMGLLPVTHGDAVFDFDQYAILSGDDILEQLCTGAVVKRAIFVSDIPCVYDRDPASSNAKRISHILVNEKDRSLRQFLLPEDEIPKDDKDESRAREAVPDVTGGMAAKLRAATNAAKNGVPVRVLNAQSLQSALELNDSAFASVTLVPQVGTLLIASPDRESQK